MLMHQMSQHQEFEVNPAPDGEIKFSAPFHGLQKIAEARQERGKSKTRSPHSLLVQQQAYDKKVSLPEIMAFNNIRSQMNTLHFPTPQRSQSMLAKSKQIKNQFTTLQNHTEVQSFVNSGFNTQKSAQVRVKSQLKQNYETPL